MGEHVALGVFQGVVLELSAVELSRPSSSFPPYRKKIRELGEGGTLGLLGWDALLGRREGVRGVGGWSLGTGVGGPPCRVDRGTRW